MGWGWPMDWCVANPRHQSMAEDGGTMRDPKPSPNRDLYNSSIYLGMRDCNKSQFKIFQRPTQ